MGYCGGSVGNFLWIIVWRVVVIFMAYCEASSGNLLWVIVWRVVVIFLWVLFGEW